MKHFLMAIATYLVFASLARAQGSPQTAVPQASSIVVTHSLGAGQELWVQLTKAGIGQNNRVIIPMNPGGVMIVGVYEGSPAAPKTLAVCPPGNTCISYAPNHVTSWVRISNTSGGNATFTLLHDYNTCPPK